MSVYIKVYRGKRLEVPLEIGEDEYGPGVCSLCGEAGCDMHDQER